MYTHQTTVRLQHTDAAGVIYFASVFTLAHECYEAFLDNHLPLGKLLADGKYLAPIVHASADIALPMRASDKITIEMNLAKTGNSSFELSYRFVDSSGNQTATAKTVHVVVERQSRKSLRIPDELTSVLNCI
jgi:1,4-dihydroxy-2-naphthoyl-CoA hydrolase